jgi:type I restriction enzyme S subunit
MSEWRTFELRQFMDFNPATPLVKGTSAIKIGMEHLVPNGKKIYNWQIADYNGGTKFQNGDTLVARITPCLENGKIGFVDMLKDGEIAFGSTEFMVLRAKDGVSDTQFVFYFAYWSEFRDLCVQLMTGTSGRQRIETDALKTREFLFPPLPVQQTIAEILSSLDDKIDLLTRQNTTLEALAQTYFRQWFIYEASNEWETKTLGEFFPVVTGKRDANYSTDDGKYPFFTCSQSILSAPSFSFDGAAVILAGNGDFNVKRYCGKFEAYQRTYVLIPYESKYCNWLYLLMSIMLNDITAGHHGSVISYLTKNMITDFSFLFPRHDITKKLNQLDYLFEKIDSNTSQILTLQKLRDTLLPKLISGEVRVRQ